MAWWLFQNLVVTAVLAVVVVAVCRTSRIGPVGRHALWLVVLVKFVTPPLVIWPWPVPDPLGVAELAMVPSDRDAADVAEPGLHVPTSPVAPYSRSSVTPGETSRSVPIRDTARAWPWLIGVWLAGSLGLIGVEAVRLGRLARQVRAGRPADVGLVRRVTELSSQMKMRPVPVRVVPGSAPPAVWGIGRPVMLWPASLTADASGVCVDGLLVHELAHVKRGDHIVGWIELAAGVVWWWNPLFWFVRSAMREQAELACDGWVISALPHGRRAYAESLLALSAGTAWGPMSLAAVGVRAGSRRLLERRLAMIMQGRVPLHLTRVGLLSLALLAAATLPGWAAGAQDPPPPPPPVPVITPVMPTPPVARPVVAPAGRPQSAPPSMPVVVAPMVAPVAPTQQPTPPAPVLVQPAPGRVVQNWMLYSGKANLPADSQRLVEGFEADRDAIQREADQKIDARRQTLVAALQALQDQYAKDGKLDEAVAIRDYLRAGLPGLDSKFTFWKGAGGGR